MNNGQILAFTGHRPSKIGGYGASPAQDYIQDSLEAIFDEFRPERIISGMALGVDQLAAEIAVRQKVPFTAAIPFEGQEGKWPRQSQEKYRALLAKAADVMIVCPGGYAAWKMQTRNKWMVDNCKVLVAVWDGSSGGTANCVAYASGKVLIRYIRPDGVRWVAA